MLFSPSLASNVATSTGGPLVEVLLSLASQVYYPRLVPRVHEDNDTPVELVHLVAFLGNLMK
jgi:hypothetical protein